MKKLQESLLDDDEKLLDETDIFKNIKYLERYNREHRLSQWPDAGLDHFYRELKIGDLVLTDSFNVGLICDLSEDKTQCFVSLNKRNYDKKSGFVFNCRHCIKIDDYDSFSKVID